MHLGLHPRVGLLRLDELLEFLLSCTANNVSAGGVKSPAKITNLGSRVEVESS